MELKPTLHNSILKDMSEGVLVIGFGGIVQLANPAALAILQKSPEELVGNPFALSFFDYPENDAFIQTILDAVYDKENPHQSMVSYHTATTQKHLHITTSFLREGEDKTAVIIVLSDISELIELRDAVKAMAKIKQLNKQLQLRNQLLSETFGRYLSDEIVQELLEKPDGLALGGKKKELTILISDLRGFTTISEQMEAQDLVTMLNHYFACMNQIIDAQGGTLIEFLGDSLFVIFGAPKDNPNHALDSVVCAIKMQNAMAECNAWNVEHGYPQLEMGIGINTGKVIIGNIGSKTRTKYGVIGNQVNLCSRIESYSVGNQIIISPTTFNMINQPLDVASQLNIAPKGIKEPLKVYIIDGIGGSYNLSCRQESPELYHLGQPFAITYEVILQKHNQLKKIPGSLLAISAQECIIQTDEPQNIFDNLSLELPCGQAFAKVTALAEKNLHLRFTYLPTGFSAWLAKQAKK